MSSSSSTTRSNAAASTASVTRMLRRRKLLGREWICRIVHGVPGSGALLVELTQLELTITACHPAVATRWLREWAIADSRLIHNPDLGPMPGCRYCTPMQGSASA